MAGQIITWESRFGDRSLLEQAVRNPSSDGDPAIPADGVADSPVLVARVNQSRWLVDCPTCFGAEFASTVRLTFFCCECRNRAYGNQPLPVEMPDGRDAIEAALLARPDPITRNWQQPETVDDLLAENETMGV